MPPRRPTFLNCRKFTRPARLPCCPYRAIPQPIANEALGIGHNDRALVQWADTNLFEWATSPALRPAARGVRRGLPKYPRAEKHQACATVIADLVQLAWRKSKVGDDRACIDSVRRQQKPAGRDAVSLTMIINSPGLTPSEQRLAS